MQHPADAPLTPRGRRRIYAATLTLTLILLGGAAALTRLSGNEDTRPVPPLTVRTLTAEAEDAYPVTRRFVGRVEAARESAVGFELGGMVLEVRVDEGERVTRNQILARLDTRRLDARRRELQAILEEARAGTALADSTRERVRAARAENAVSAQRLDEAEREYQARRAAEGRAEAALAALDVDLDKAVLRAPFDAIVSERFVDEGQVVPGGQPIVTLLDRRNPEARIGIAPAAVDGLAPGQPHPLDIDGRTVEGVVVSVLPQRDAGTRSVEVRFSLDVPLEQVRRGDLAALERTRMEAQRGFWLPLSALTESSRGLWSCFVAVPVADDNGATHQLARRELVLLHQEQDRVYVRGTLETGDLVVGEGLQRLAPGLPVRVEAAS
ncbi:hypothetical protein ABI59_18080 [Acidobacteria bacterium Mor1]|nr:hypothetical protein ABI59_18080 [Acidobacteria bacterium Mor1]